MAQRGRENQGDWAEQVPWTRPRGPYRDYGWEAHQSGLPEFRDPSSHFMPYERSRLEPWQPYRERDVIYPEELQYSRERWEREEPGPYSGIGPRNYQRPDKRIYEDVCERMTEHGQLDASEIQVEVQNSEVILSGNVPNRRAKRLAEDIADSVSGVRDVHNQLKIQKGTVTPQRWVDRVGRTGVFPVSAGSAPREAEARGMAGWGQGERGAEGYADHGDSELRIGRVDEDKI